MSKKCKRCQTKMILKRQAIDPYYECPYCLKVEHLYPPKPVTRKEVKNVEGMQVMADRKDVIECAGVYKIKGV